MGQFACNTFLFDTLKYMLFIYTNWQFSSFPLFPLLKKRPPIIEKSVWQSFENKKCEVTAFYLFPCCSSWWTCFLPWPPSNGSNLSSKIVNIGFFGKRGNLSNCFAQIRGEKNKKSKFRRTQFGKGAERIVLHIKLIFVAVPKAVYFCDRFRSENDRSDDLADKSGGAVPDKI